MLSLIGSPKKFLMSMRLLWRRGRPLLHKAFSDSQLSQTLGDRSIRELENYLHTLTATYTTSDVSQGSSSQQAPSNASATHRAPTLQEAILSIPQIEDVLDQWESGEPETPLVQAQLSAHRVRSYLASLSRPSWRCPSCQGATERACSHNCRTAGKAHAEFCHVKAKQQALQRSGQQRIDDLKTHNEKWPFFASFLKSTNGLGSNNFRTTLPLFPSGDLGFVWLEQVFQQFVPGLSYWLGQPVFGISVFAPFYFLLVLTLVILLLFTIFGFGRWLLDSRRSALRGRNCLRLRIACRLLSLVAYWSCHHTGS